ncbi:hypothetical protein MAP00_004788 [Monascus purpureus]|nr:hypothetical protein MAP00_004788 [Monascus purpureus]
MPASVPEGLVTVSGRVLSSELKDDGVDMNDIARLWRVYNAIASAQSGHVGRRLENLFWRIWGSRRRHDTLRGSTVAKLFLKISQTSPLPGIPVQQPKQVGNNHGNEPSSRSLRGPQKGPLLSPKDQSREHPQQRQLQDRTRNQPRRPAPLPPILKKSQSATGSQGERHKTTRLLITSPGGRSVTRKPSNPPTPAGELVNRQGQKRSYFVVGKGGNPKRKPVTVRRKSSHPTSASGTEIRSPQISPISPVSLSGLTADPSPVHPDEKFCVSKPQLLRDPAMLSPESLDDEESKQTLSASLSAQKILMAIEERPASPKSPPLSPTRGFAASSIHSHAPAPISSSLEQQGRNTFQQQEQLHSTSLVDKGFRSRFAERRLQAQRPVGVSSENFNSAIDGNPVEFTTNNNTYRRSILSAESCGFDGGPRAGSCKAPPFPSTAPVSQSPHVSPPVGGLDPDLLPPSTQTFPGSLPFPTSTYTSRPRSQLSHLIEQSRSKNLMSRSIEDREVK